MEPIVQIIISEDVGTVNNGTINTIENPVLALGVPVIPTTTTFAVTVIVAENDFSLPQTIELSIIDNEGKTLFSSGETELPPATVLPNNMALSMNLKNVLFKYVGQYTVKFTLNNKEYNHSFLVKKSDLIET